MRWIGFGVAVAFWPGWIGSVIAPRWAVLAALTPLVAKIDLKRFRPLFVLLPFLTLLWAGLSLFWTPDRLTGIHEFLHLLILVGIGLSVSGLDDLSPVLTAVGWGLAVSAALAVCQYAEIWSPVEQMSAPAGLFYNRLMLAEAAAPIFLWAFLVERYWLLAALTPAMLLCQSRIAVLAVLIGFVAARPRWGIPSLLIAGALAAIAWHFGLPPFGAGKMDSAYIRIEIWNDAISGVTINGQGIGSFPTIYPRWEFAHSDFLQSLFEFGAGSLPLLAFLVVAARGPVTAERAAFIAMLVEFAVSFPLHRPVTAFFLTVLAVRLGAVRDHLCRGERRGRDQIILGTGWSYENRPGANLPDQNSGRMVSIRSDAAHGAAAG